MCGSRQVSMYEMWKRKQIYENARKMHGVKVLVEEFGTMEKATPWVAMTWLEEWTGRKRS